jgi:metal-dependent amidase/aminoacylase/carboxypeptidase family protein
MCRGAVRGGLPRETRARGRLSAAGGQRRRRDDRRPGGRRPAAPADRDGDRIQGIVTEAGSAANVIPGTSRGNWIVRTETVGELAALKARVIRCFEAGALATGCEVSITATSPDYADLRPDPVLLAHYRANAEALGRVFPELPRGVAGAATDMGNVSHAVRTIHPMLGLGCAPAVNHQPEFTAACVTAAADRAVLDGAIALAWTAADLAAEPV